jgi:hypothetical protein
VRGKLETIFTVPVKFAPGAGLGDGTGEAAGCTAGDGAGAVVTEGVGGLAVLVAAAAVGGTVGVGAAWHPVRRTDAATTDENKRRSLAPGNMRASLGPLR